MSDLTDALEHDVWKRRAHRWTIGLAVQLAVNCALVALALGGFGAARPEFPAAIPSAPPAPHAAPSEDPAPTQPLAPAPPQPDEPPRIIERSAPPAVETPPTKEPTTVPPEPPPPPAPPAPPEKAPPANAPPELEAASLTIVNPPDTGGPVHLTVNGVVYRLSPGEYCQLSAASPRRVAYHRGDDFGYARHDLARGTHAFEIGNTGWTLLPLAPALARPLVEQCRQRTAERE